jgi:uncharacterized membrane protein YgcG
MQFACAVEQTLAEAIVSRIKRLQYVRQSASRNFNSGSSTGNGTHGGGDSYGNGHGKTLPSD